MNEAALMEGCSQWTVLISPVHRALRIRQVVDGLGINVLGIDGLGINVLGMDGWC